MPPRPPVPPFTLESATAKVRAAEDAWNTRDPERVAGAYTPESRWRNRAEFDPEGYMPRREASINDVRIREQDRKFRWPQGPRPADHPGLTQLGL